MIPDLESLRCFEAAATQLNFRKAAQAVALSPPAFGERIRRLEEELETRLFERTTRKVALTDAGLRLLPQARSLLEAARGLWDAVHDERRAPFTLTLGTRFELGLSWITPALASLSADRPERTLDLVFGDSPELLARTETGAIDASVTSYRLATARFAYALLHEEEYVFVASPELLARRPLRRTADAGGHVLLDAHADLPLFRYLLEASPPEERWSFARVEHLGTTGAIRYRALEGAGVAVLPRYLVRGDLRDRRLRRLLPRRPLARDSFRLVWRTGHPLAHELEALAGELRARPLR